MAGDSDEEFDETDLPLPTEQLAHTRDGRTVLLRRAKPADAHALLSALNEVAAEGRFLLRREWQLTPELEQRWMRVASSDLDLLLVVVELDDTASGNETALAGSLSLVRGRPEFIRHTAEMGLWLRSAYREVGLGSVLLEYALRWAATHNVEKIALSVRSSNKRAANLYIKYGFVEEGRRRSFIKAPGGYEDELLLSRFVGQRALGFGNQAVDRNNTAASEQLSDLTEGEE